MTYDTLNEQTYIILILFYILYLRSHCTVCTAVHIVRGLHIFNVLQCDFYWFSRWVVSNHANHMNILTKQQNRYLLCFSFLFLFPLHFFNKPITTPRSFRTWKIHFEFLVALLHLFHFVGFKIFFQNGFCFNLHKFIEESLEISR